MKLNELSPQQLAQLYRQELTSAFPPEELKPLRSMLSLMEQGRYQALGLYDGEDLVAYALIWLEPGCPFALLDYLGIERERTRVEWVSAAEGAKFAATMQEFTETVRALGENRRLEDLRCKEK